jgi:hypothetical protein
MAKGKKQGRDYTAIDETKQGGRPWNYTVVDPSQLHNGKSYSSLAEDWFNWYVSADADKRNFGPVVFLRSAPIPPNGKSAAYSEMGVTNSYDDDAFYDRPYQNLPNVRVGAEKLQIRKDQAVFIPIIIAYEVARKPYFDWGQMMDLTGSLIDYGDDPPLVDQLKINGQNVRGIEDMRKFRILTSIFTVVVPEADYGRSIKDFLEVTVNPGHYPAIVEGYFVLLKDFEPGYTYLIHSRASAGREQRGPYIAELLYEIKVLPTTKRDTVGAIPYHSSARNQSIIRRTLKEKTEKGEMDEGKARAILEATGNVEDKNL